ncbi:GNAT family N-acetyltransferase [Streptomyces sp. NBC_00212]|uniref:GNAT family N-acetyltransferase n=1 Tax=Streptomyces sp. NBC_00212 TaxID=2975684 RepID=UPI00386841C6
MSYGEGVRAVYAGAFGAAPWNEAPNRADAYMDRLGSDVTRPGFTAAVALEGEEVLGWATAWTTPRPFPSGRCYLQVAAVLGEQRIQQWLCGAREVDELAVAGRGRGSGLGARLLHAVTEDRADGRCWLLTPARAADALCFYAVADWTPATHPAPSGASHAVFLGPRHPARAFALAPCDHRNRGAPPPCVLPTSVRALRASTSGIVRTLVVGTGRRLSNSPHW